VVRLFVFAAWRLALLEALEGSTDPVVAAVAAKGVKEVHYHRDYAARWVVTLAGGTEESRARVTAAVEATWPYLPELGRPDAATDLLVPSGVAADPVAVGAATHDVITQLLAAADLPEPLVETSLALGRDGGRAGAHTPWLAPLLEEMQALARAHPKGTW
jgi:ring-1,2-phenylacetyl-CoA epoxidase subunit PaaC